MYIYNAVITNVVDGDTFDLNIDLGFHIHLHERVRVLDVDTPEKRGKEKELGEICTEYARKHFLNKSVVLCSFKDDKEPTTDSFGRWLAHVTLLDGSNITTIYTNLGVNKKSDNYSEENVLKLKEKL